MLIHALIENLMLIEKAQVGFESSFIAITGESGSGKSSLMQALKLALGAKSSSEMIRKNQSQGRVSITLDLSALDPLTRKRLEKIFDESAIPWPQENLLILQRILSPNKPSRAFVGDSPVTQTLLARLGGELVEVVDAGESLCLETLDAHLECLDAFAGAEELREELQTTWLQLQTDQIEKGRLQNLLDSRSARRELLEFQVQEIEESALQQGEEEALDQALRGLNNRKQLDSCLDSLFQELQSPTLTKIGRLQAQLERLTDGMPQSQNLHLCLQGALVQANEAHSLTMKLREDLHKEPHDAQSITARLDLLHLLKKKYGSSPQLINEHLIRAKNELSELDNAHAGLQTIQDNLQKLQERYNALCKQIHELRIHHGELLSSRVIEVIRDLNMPHADFFVTISINEPGPTGLDSVEFFLGPNPGQPALSVRKFASGGEMARLFLALKTLKAHKRIPPTLIFDEIDASIGGQSAARLGDKLQALSDTRQVICITHFSQVAKRANLHLVLEKQVANGQTCAKVQTLLSKSARACEINRMLGNPPTSKK